jgi:hypothetical protein
MHVTLDFPTIDYWSALGMAVAGAGLVFAILLRRRLGSAAMILMIAGCGSLLLSGFLLFAAQSFPSGPNNLFFFRFYTSLWHALGVAGLALVIAAAFAGRRARERRLP